MRKILPWSILAGLILVVSGCHGNGGTNSNPGPTAVTSATPSPQVATEQTPAKVPATEPAKLHDERPVLVCFGDSLTAGLGTDAGQSYPDYLQADLDKLHYRYRVVNQGISGNTTKDGVERMPDILALHPAVAV